jgi:hypothetical protein
MRLREYEHLVAVKDEKIYKLENTNTEKQLIEIKEKL